MCNNLKKRYAAFKAWAEIVQMASLHGCLLKKDNFYQWTATQWCRSPKFFVKLLQNFLSMLECSLKAGQNFVVFGFSMPENGSEWKISSFREIKRATVHAKGRLLQKVAYNLLGIFHWFLPTSKLFRRIRSRHRDQNPQRPLSSGMLKMR